MILTITIILILALLIEIIYKPRIDYAKETGYLLWYNYKNNRKYFKL